MTEDFSMRVRNAVAAAKDHAALLRSLPDEDHTYLCESLASRVVAVFEAASSASEGFLSFHQKRDANGAAMIYGLSVQRDAYTKTCLFIRVNRRISEPPGSCTRAATWSTLSAAGGTSRSCRSRTRTPS